MMFEKEAEGYVKAFTDRSHIWSNDKLMQLQLREAYKDGAKFGYNKGLEAGRPKWHYLRKNPDDLPTDKYFKITSDGYIAFYDCFLGKWYDHRSDELTYQPSAWAEIPVFEEE